MSEIKRKKKNTTVKIQDANKYTIMQSIFVTVDYPRKASNIFHGIIIL